MPLGSEGHVAWLGADTDEYEYVELRRFAVWILESLDRALGLSVFEPPAEQHDPGVTLLELLAYVTDALGDYADRVAAEDRLRTQRRAVAAAAAVGVAFVCWRRCR